MSTAVIAGRDTSPILEFPKHILDFVSLLIELSVELDFGFAVLLCRDAGFDAFLTQGISEPIGIISTISQQSFCGWQCIYN